MCQHKPGWFAPGEAEQAAAGLGMTVHEFFVKFLQVDYWDGETPIYLLTPALVDQEPGTVVSYPAGACVFHQADGHCAIYAHRPHECRVAIHDGNQGRDTHRGVALEWRDYQDTVAALLGRQPEPVELDPLALLAHLCREFDKPEAGG